MLHSTFKLSMVKMPLKGEHLIVIEITLLIMENHGKIIELCFWISVGTLSLSLETIRIHHGVRVGYKNESRGSPIAITRLAEWWKTEIRRDVFFFPTVIRIMNPFLAHHLVPVLYWKSIKKGLQSDMRHGDVISTLQWRHRSTCGQCAVDVRLSWSVFVPRPSIRRPSVNNWLKR